MVTVRKSTVFRVTGLPAGEPNDEDIALFKRTINENLSKEERLSNSPVVNLVPSCYDNGSTWVALVEFQNGVPSFLSKLVQNPLEEWQVEMGDTDIIFDRHFFGFTQLYATLPGPAITADVIAITSLNGHAYNSWRGKGNLGRMWLRDFLCKDLPYCRTMTYGYNSKLSSHGIDTIMDYGRGFLEEIKQVRNTAELRERPIVFIAHSFGGIILAHCLIKAVQTSEGDHPTIASLHKATYGMLLFGTPHKGLIMDDIEKMLAGRDDHPRRALLQQIDSKSDLLMSQLVDFKNLIRDRKVVSFYETEQTRALEYNAESQRWKRTGNFITAVETDSAMLHLPDHIEDKIPLHVDHSHLVKFDSRNAPGYRSALEKLRRFEKDASTVISSRFARADTQETFTVGFSLSEIPETEHFVARQEELADIRKTLNSDGRRRTAVLHGLGGIGKTQLTVAYAKRHKANYSAIFWVNSKDEDSLKQSFAKVARRILKEHPSASWLSSVKDDSNLDEVIDAVKRWLDFCKNTQWLLVYDNYDNPKLRGNADLAAVDLRRFLPEADHGSIIITTRSSQVKLGHRIKVDKLEDIRDSLDILSHTSGRANVVVDPDAVKLAKKLDGFPLALATAGAYLDQIAMSFADYLRQYEESWLELLKTSPDLESYEDRALYSTWQLSFDQIKRHNELSIKLLQLWAYFDNQDVWFELLRRDVNRPEWLSRLTQNELTFTHAVRILCDYGLVEVNKSSQESENESRGYSMHSCVHSWTIHVLNQEWEAEMAQTALKCVGMHVPSGEEPKYWMTQKRLIRHAARCWDMVTKGVVEEDDIAWVLHSLADLYSDQGKLDEAEKMYMRALQGKEKTWGPEHTLTLDTVNNLGILYADQGKLDEAKNMYLRALQGYEKALGHEQVKTYIPALNTTVNLASLHKQLGRIDDAKDLYSRALDGLEIVVGHSSKRCQDIRATLEALGGIIASSSEATS